VQSNVCIKGNDILLQFCNGCFINNKWLRLLIVLHYVLGILKVTVGIM